MKWDFLSHRLSNYVYKHNGQTVALLSFGDTADEDKKNFFEIWRIYISKDYQKKGIGSELINFAEQKGIERGYKECLIWAFKENKNAISFYKKHGYIEDKEEYLGDIYSAYGVRLCKKLI